jgi:hypothetical protein
MELVIQFILLVPDTDVSKNTRNQLQWPRGLMDV